MKYILYYTDSQLDEEIAEYCRNTLCRHSWIFGIPIISVSQKPLDFGTNICVGELPRTRKSMNYQIAKGCEQLQDSDYIFLCEHDDLYHPSHFNVLPADPSCWLFNLNRYFYWPKYGIVHKDKRCNRRAFSHAVVTKERLFKDYLNDGGKRWHKDKTVPNRLYWESEYPNIDYRHGDNLSRDGRPKRRLMKEGIRDQITEVPGWRKEGGVYVLIP